MTFTNFPKPIDGGVIDPWGPLPMPEPISEAEAGSIPIMRHLSVITIEGQTGIRLTSLPSSAGLGSSLTLSTSETQGDIWAQWDTSLGAFHFYGTGEVSKGFWSDTEVRIGEPGWGGILTVQAVDGTNEGGEIVLKGAAANADWHADNFAGDFRLHDGTTTHLRIYQADGTLALVGGRIRLGETTTPTAVDSWGHLYTKSDNELYFQDGAGNEKVVSTGTDTAFTAPTLLNSWVNFGGGETNAGYRINADGLVTLEGVVKNGSSASAIIFTLPVGYRPATFVDLVGISNEVICKIQIAATGAVKNAVGGSTAWVSLNNVNFYV